MTEERRQLIKRLEECKYKHKEFYKAHPDFLEELNSKIYALKNGNEYTLIDANWVICYAGGKIRDTHIGFDDKTQQLFDLSHTLCFLIMLFYCLHNYLMLVILFQPY